jgi:hypothetical protein
MWLTAAGAALVGVVGLIWYDEQKPATTSGGGAGATQKIPPQGTPVIIVPKKPPPAAQEVIIQNNGASYPVSKVAGSVLTIIAPDAIASIAPSSAWGAPSTGNPASNTATVTLTGGPGSFIVSWGSGQATVEVA